MSQYTLEDLKRILPSTGTCPNCLNNFDRLKTHAKFCFNQDQIINYIVQNQNKNSTSTNLNAVCDFLKNFINRLDKSGVCPNCKKGLKLHCNSCLKSLSHSQLVNLKRNYFSINISNELNSLSISNDLSSTSNSNSSSSPSSSLSSSDKRTSISVLEKEVTSFVNNYKSKFKLEQ